jgi:hypothetical protein
MSVGEQYCTTPAAIDFGGDGPIDLVILDRTGYLTLFPCERRKTAAFTFCALLATVGWLWDSTFRYGRSSDSGVYFGR